MGIRSGVMAKVLIPAVAIYVVALTGYRGGRFRRAIVTAPKSLQEGMPWPNSTPAN